MDRLIRWSLRLATVAALGLGLWIAFRGVTVGDVAAVLRSVSVGALAARVLPLVAVGFLLRAGRFQVLLGEPYGRFRDVVATVLLSQAANNVLPLHAGEFVKTRDFAVAGHPLRRVIVAQAVEKLVEAGSLAIVCAPAMAICLAHRSRLAIFLGVCACAGMAAVAAAARWFDVRPSRVGAALIWAVGADAIEVALVVVTLQSLGHAPSLGASLTVLGAVNLAIALPSAPGHAGAIEAGAALALVALGSSHRDAVAFAVLYRVVQWVPVTVGGALVWGWRAGMRAKGRAVAAPPVSAAELWASVRRREPRS
jgi:uncharacterized membrane protein YbhN (UPF0104 family)